MTKINPPESAALSEAVTDKIVRHVHADVRRGSETVAAEVIALVREQVAREIEAERDSLRELPHPADAQWLRALDSAAAIAMGARSK